MSRMFIMNRTKIQQMPLSSTLRVNEKRLVECYRYLLSLHGNPFTMRPWMGLRNNTGKMVDESRAMDTFMEWSDS
jgi:hypothetical protein